MPTAVKLLNFLLVFASLSLGVSFFLPLYQSANGAIRYADEWGLFFWSIPVLVMIFMLSNRWLKAALYFISAIGGLLDLFLLTFLATFKSTPLTGFNIAKLSLIILIVSWLILCAISLFTSKNIKRSVAQ